MVSALWNGYFLNQSFWIQVPPVIPIPASLQPSTQGVSVWDSLRCIPVPHVGELSWILTPGFGMANTNWHVRVKQKMEALCLPALFVSNHLSFKWINFWKHWDKIRGSLKIGYTKCVCNMEYNNDKKNEILMLATKLMKLEIMLSEISHTQKEKHHIFSLICKS